MKPTIKPAAEPKYTINLCDGVVLTDKARAALNPIMRATGTTTLAVKRCLADTNDGDVVEMETRLLNWPGISTAAMFQQAAEVAGHQTLLAEGVLTIFVK